MKRLLLCALVDASPLAFATSSASPLHDASTLRRFENRVRAAAPVGVAPLQYALKTAALRRSFRSACRQPLGFGDFKHRQDEKGSIHQLSEAAHIPSTHRAHDFRTKEDVRCLREMLCLRRTFWELGEKGITATQTTHESWNFAGKNRNSAWRVSFLAVTLPMRREMRSPV